eukprot:TRINITY_DN1375_c0_g1_i3.p2 TRINITY_DN1375_c0_g1~~TRINITY_DN1375_c0_g1_i3.p2  ORF type:complete len:199 (+),score=55.83 TRINITY_DN1375_c0_g1_i3:71-598(+)
MFRALSRLLGWGSGGDDAAAVAAWTARAVAVMCGHHPRLGARSPLAALARPTLVDICFLSLGAPPRACEIYTWGWNQMGSLGINRTEHTTVSTPTLAKVIPARDPLLKFVTGGYFCLALLESGKVIMWGGEFQPVKGIVGNGEKTWFELHNLRVVDVVCTPEGTVFAQTDADRVW